MPGLQRRDIAFERFQQPDLGRVRRQTTGVRPQRLDRRPGRLELTQQGRQLGRTALGQNPIVRRVGVHVPELT